MAERRVLWQFPASHFCEKARWCLDAKGLSFAVRNLIPGLHRPFTRRIAGTNTVPILVDGGVVVADSTQIALHLDRTYPERPLLPVETAARAKALAVADEFERTTGVDARRWIYGQLLDHTAGLAVMMHEFPWLIRVGAPLLAPLLKPGLRRLYGVTPESAEKARLALEESFERVESLTGGDPSRYLVGDRLGLADITVASMLALVIVPPGSTWDVPEPFPPSFLVTRDAARARPGGRWVLERYARDRAAP